jgi:hypothetical protein
MKAAAQQSSPEDALPSSEVGSPPTEVTGPRLDSETLHLLLATTRALIGAPIEEQHYLDMFLWRADNVPGYAEAYREFREAVERLADDPALQVASSCSSAEHEFARRLFTQLLPEPLRDRLDRMIRAEILALFAFTDAWRLLGYPAWQGLESGLG